MPLRKKKHTVRDTIEHTYDDLRAQVAKNAPILRDQVVDQVTTKAPIVRDQVVSKLGEGREEIKTRLPELHASLFERLPDDVTNRLPEGAKPKKKKSKLKKVAIIGLIAAAGGFVFSKLKAQSSGPTYTPPNQGSGVDLSKPADLVNKAADKAKSVADDATDKAKKAADDAADKAKDVADDAKGAADDAADKAKDVADDVK